MLVLCEAVNQVCEVGRLVDLFGGLNPLVDENSAILGF
jgi:hypothetical protein